MKDGCFPSWTRDTYGHTIIEYMLIQYSKFLKFIYSEKATKFCKIFPLLLTVCTLVKSKGKISQNFVVFSEYMNFNCGLLLNLAQTVSVLLD